jgi:hypothetical protein
LPEVLDTAIDIAADIIRVVLLEFDGRYDVARQDTIAETRGEAFNLRFNAFSHIK